MTSVSSYTFFFYFYTHYCFIRKTSRLCIDFSTFFTKLYIVGTLPTRYVSKFSSYIFNFQWFITTKIFLSEIKSIIIVTKTSNNVSRSYIIVSIATNMILERRLRGCYFTSIHLALNNSYAIESGGIIIM